VIDLHCHFLPGIDDGAQVPGEALALARAAVAAGITTSVMTPHVHIGRYDNNLTSIKTSFAAFQKALLEENIALQIRIGGEVRIAAEIMALVEDGEAPYIGALDGHSIMLLEFPHSHLMLGADKLIQWLLARKIKPLIAHPERNKDVMRNFERIYPFVTMGCLLQVTGASIIGQFGKPAQDCALKLFEREWVTVVATDAHNLQHRPPNLDLARKALVELGGETFAQRMTLDTPAEIVRGNTWTAG
jgi:protein-tyrosine phosphatase